MRECVDHAARARVKNAALERDARRVGALELDHARRAGLCVIITRVARPSSNCRLKRRYKRRVGTSPLLINNGFVEYFRKYYFRKYIWQQTNSLELD